MLFEEEIEKEEEKQIKLDAEKNFMNNTSGLMRRYFLSLEGKIENFDVVKQNF